jgi:hypothetical protein
MVKRKIQIIKTPEQYQRRNASTDRGRVDGDYKG